MDTENSVISSSRITTGLGHNSRSISCFHHVRTRGAREPSLKVPNVVVPRSGSKRNWFYGTDFEPPAPTRYCKVPLLMYTQRRSTLNRKGNEDYYLLFGRTPGIMDTETVVIFSVYKRYSILSKRPNLYSEYGCTDEVLKSSRFWTMT